MFIAGLQMRHRAQPFVHGLPEHLLGDEFGDRDHPALSMSDP
jgi:hypothetical protein